MRHVFSSNSDLLGLPFNEELPSGKSWASVAVSKLQSLTVNRPVSNFMGKTRLGAKILIFPSYRCPYLIWWIFGVYFIS